MSRSEECWGQRRKSGLLVSGAAVDAEREKAVWSLGCVEREDLGGEREGECRTSLRGEDRT